MDANKQVQSFALTEEEIDKLKKIQSDFKERGFKDMSRSKLLRLILSLFPERVNYSLLDAAKKEENKQFKKVYEKLIRKVEDAERRAQKGR